MAARREEGKLQLGMPVNFDLPAALLVSRVSRVQDRNLWGATAQGLNLPWTRCLSGPVGFLLKLLEKFNKNRAESMIKNPDVLLNASHKQHKFYNE